MLGVAGARLLPSHGGPGGCAGGGVVCPAWRRGIGAGAEPAALDRGYLLLNRISWLAPGGPAHSGIDQHPGGGKDVRARSRGGIESGVLFQENFKKTSRKLQENFKKAFLKLS